MVAWLVFGVGLSNTNVIHLIYILLILVATIMRSGRMGMSSALGFGLLIFSEIVVLAQMAYGFDSVQQRVDDNPTSAFYVDWIGFMHHTTLLKALRAHLAIIILVIVHRMSYWWIHSHPKESPKELPESIRDLETDKDQQVSPKGAQMRKTSTDENVAAVLPGAHTSTNHVGKNQLAPAPMELGPRVAAYLINFYSVYGYEVCLSLLRYNLLLLIIC